MNIILAYLSTINSILICFVLLDITKESIELAISDHIPVNNLTDKVPKTDARYHLYKYQHKRNGTQTNSICKLI